MMKIFYRDALENVKKGAVAAILGGSAAYFSSQFGADSILAAKVYAVICGVTVFTCNLVTPSYVNNVRRDRRGFTMLAVDSIISIFALRHFNMIGNKGTVFTGIFTALIAFNAIESWKKK